MLTPVQRAAREGKITGSFLPSLMAGNEAGIYDKWLELIGDPAWVPEDLSENWPVQLGSHVEPLALDWCERKTQHALTRRGEVVTHPVREYVACTLDAYREHDDTVIDAKASGAFMSLDHIIAYYTPQMIVQRACVQCRNAALLIVHGGAEPAEYPVAIDPDYERALWQRVDQFWRCVQNLTPPVRLRTLSPPDQWRTINLDLDTADNRANWAAAIKPALETWNANHDSVESFEAARTEIKQLLPDDCRKLTWAGVVVTRARNRAITIKRAKTTT